MIMQLHFYKWLGGPWPTLLSQPWIHDMLLYYRDSGKIWLSPGPSDYAFKKENVEDGQSCEQFGLSINDKDVFGIGCWFYAILIWFKIGYSYSSCKITMNQDKSAQKKTKV